MMTEARTRYRWVILGLALVAQLSVALAGQSIAPLAPLFQPELGLSKAQVGFFSSAVFAGSWCVFLMAGTFTDRFGVRKIVSIGQTVTGSLMLIMAVVGSFLQASVVMFTAGVARGTIAPGSDKAVMDWFPPSTRATVMGFKQAGVPLAGVITAAVLPTLALAIGWRSAIAVVGSWIIACGVLTAIAYRDGARAGQSHARKSSIRSGLGILVRNRRVWTLSLVVVLYAAVQVSLTSYLALYFKEVVLVPFVADEAARVVAAGGFLAVCQAGGVFGRVFWGAVSDRAFHGRRMIVMALIGALTAIMSLVLRSFALDLPLSLLAVTVFAYGATAVGFNGLSHALMVETAGRKLAGTGVGLVMSVGQLGVVGGPPLFGFVVDLTGSYDAAWTILAGLAASGAVVGLLAAREEGTSTTAET